jgi:hypothetical protein
MKGAAIAWLCVGLGSGALQIAQSPPQEPVFRAGTDVVTLDVSVRRKSAPVTGLTARDFELLDNGVAQRIAVERVDTIPVDVSLVFDVYLSALLPATKYRPGTDYGSDLARIPTLLRPTDRLRVITCGNDVREVLPMQTPRSWDSPDAAARWLLAGRHLGDGYLHDPRLLGESVFDGLLLAMARPPEPDRRHLIVAFVADGDRGSVLQADLLETIAAHTDALLHIVASGVVLHPPVRAPVIEYLRDVVTAAATATGGEIHESSANTFTSIFKDFRQSYVLRYTATGVLPGGWHTVSVRTPGFPTYEVRSRKGYMGR